MGEESAVSGFLGRPMFSAAWFVQATPQWQAGNTRAVDVLAPELATNGIGFGSDYHGHPRRPEGARLMLVDLAPRSEGPVAMPVLTLRDQTVVIIGGSSGIG